MKIFNKINKVQFTLSEKAQRILIAVRKNDRRTVVKLLENKEPINNPAALPYDSEAINIDLDRIYEYISIYHPSDDELASAIVGFMFHISEKEVIKILQDAGFEVHQDKIHDITQIMLTLRSISQFKSANILKYSIITCGDGRVCKKCQALQGKTFSVSDVKIGENAPPLCDYCRCRMKPIFNFR